MSKKYKIKIAVGKCEFNQFYICITFDPAHKNLFKILSDGVYANTLCNYTRGKMLSLSDAKNDESVCGVSRFFYKVTTHLQLYDLQPLMDDVLNDYCNFLVSMGFDYTVLGQYKTDIINVDSFMNYDIELRSKR